jgi:hypothetical protein
MLMMLALCGPRPLGRPLFLLTLIGSGITFSFIATLRVKGRRSMGRRERWPTCAGPIGFLAALSTPTGSGITLHPLADGRTFRPRIRRKRTAHRNAGTPPGSSRSGDTSRTRRNRSKGAGTPDLIVGEFVTYLLRRYRRRLKFITILPE